MPETGEPEAPEVTETAYVQTSDGPGEDTETFYKRTPAPGQRFDERLNQTQAPPSTAASVTPERLSLRRSKSAEPTPATRTTPERPMWIGAALAAGVAGLLGLLALAAVFAYLWGGQGTSDLDAAPEDDSTWEGLKVKKGLR